MQGDDVRAGQELRQAHHRAAKGRRRHGIVAEQCAAEAGKDAGGCKADPAGADDAHGLAGERDAEQTVEREVSLPHPVVGAVGVAVERHSRIDGCKLDSSP